MMIQGRIVLATIAVGLMSAAAFGQYNNEIENLKRENARMRLGLQESEQNFQEQYRRLVERMTALQEAVVQSQEVMKQYQRRIADIDGVRQQLQSENAALRQQLQSEVAALRQQIDAESRQRQVSMQKLAELFNRHGAQAAQTAQAAQSAPTQSAAPVQTSATPAPATGKAAAGGEAQAAAAPTGGGADAPEGEYFEYVVQKGATLGAIARAYKVTTEDIRKANKLNGNVIYIGQKLLIPKK